MSGPQYKHLIRKMLPRSVSDAWERFMHFRPYDWMDGTQSFPTRVNIKGAEQIKGYRYPAPGSAPAPNVPTLEEGEDMYDVALYTRDTARAPTRVKLLFPAKYMLEAGTSTPVLTPGPNEAQERGSPSGRINPDVAKYDPTGLRHAMSASHEALEASLKKHAADHLVEYEWAQELSDKHFDKDTPMPHRSTKDIVTFVRKNSLPPLPGVPTKYVGVNGLFLPEDPSPDEVHPNIHLS